MGEKGHNNHCLMDMGVLVFDKVSLGDGGGSYIHCECGEHSWKYIKSGVRKMAQQLKSMPCSQHSNGGP